MTKTIEYSILIFMKKLSKLSLLLFVIVFLSAGCMGTPRDGTTTQTYQKAEESLQVTQAVKYEGETGKTALAILKEKYNGVEIKDFSFGQMVTAIDGKKAEDGKNFWAFYVNGVQAQVGAGSYQTKNGEQIEWKLEEIK
jgi:uncharacterized membrane protein